MTTLINPDNDEVTEGFAINNDLMIIEITGYSFEYINSLPLPRYKELLRYCVTRVNENRAMCSALGVNIKEIL